VLDAAYTTSSAVTISRDPTRYMSTLKSLLTKTWCGQATPIMWTLHSPLLHGEGT
jgi:hypothetical protein